MKTRKTQNSKKITIMTYTEQLIEAANKSLAALKKVLKTCNMRVKDCTKRETPHCITVTLGEDEVTGYHKGRITLDYRTYGQYRVAEYQDYKHGFTAIIAKA